jgi:peptidoglycan hydrolase-like protein with peptidoglycan-binding domain
VKPRHPWSRFRAFETLEAGAADYIAILRLPRYRAAWDILPSGDVVAFSDALYRGGYFTASPRIYRKALAREVTRTRGVLMGRPTLRRGATGKDVEDWQEAALGWRQPPAKDGRFGPATEAATRRWQTAHGLLNDGEVGPLSWGTVFPNVEVEA